MTLLNTATAPFQRELTYRIVPVAGFQIFLDASLRRSPEELHLKLEGWRRKHVAAYWNGCAFVV
jgi:hypothetical protein